MQLVLSLDRPRLRLWRGFLSPDECQTLTLLAAPRLTRSNVVDTTKPGSIVAQDRTSDGMSFAANEHSLLGEINWRAAAITDRDPRTFETLQILRYQPGQEYRPHYDYFPLEYASTPAELQRGGQRTGSMLIYLKTPERGGATTFPDASLRVEAIAGDALFFEYDTPQPSTLTLHGGSPVTEGEKYVATLWMRQLPFDGPAKDLRVVDDVLSVDQCQQLIGFYDANVGRAEGPPDRVVRIAGEFAGLVDRVALAMRQQFGDAMQVETIVIACIPPRTQLGNHADNVRLEGGQFVPNHTPDRTHTAVVFLNDGDGSVTYGGNPPPATSYEQVVKQKQGRMHAHRCGPNYYHRVSASDAPRYTFIVWFKRPNVI